jgi:DNA ligase-1
MAEITNEFEIDTPRLLDTLHQMISDVNEINGTNEKVTRLAKYPELRSFLKLLYDPLQTTGVTSGQLKKYKSKTSTKLRKVDMGAFEQTTNLVDLLNKLYSRELSGNEAKEQVWGFIKMYPAHESLIYKIIDKDLETRMGMTQINNAFPNLITGFSVALAKDFESGQSYFTKNLNSGWLISRKYDGIRCIVKVEKNTAVAYSRNGIRLAALAPLEELISKAIISQDKTPQSFVLDGEVCAVDASGMENFAEAVSSAKRKSVRMENYRFYVFDMLTLDEFESTHGSRKLSDRQKDLHRFVDLVSDPIHLQIVNQTSYTEDSFKQQQLSSSEHSWEGLMLRMDTEYKGKRSNDILKVKNFQTEEYVVQGYETASMRMINEKTGLENNVQVLKSVQIQHKGSVVHVGSGFNFDERRTFFEHPDLIVGKIISVKYFEESQDSSGKKSLRFPIFAALHGAQRVV